VIGMAILVLTFFFRAASISSTLGSTAMVGDLNGGAGEETHSQS
jgi:hypothetical protein